jgi:hypothetical protein
MTAYTARLLTTDLLQKQVNLVAHGFTVGKVLKFTGAYGLAQANSLANSAVVGMVSAVPSADVFFITQVGFVSGLSGLVAGSVYYLSPSSAGNLTTTRPNAVGQTIVQCLIATSTTEGFFFASDPELIDSASGFDWNVVTLGQTMVINSGYFTNAGGNVSLAIPGTFGVGDSFFVSAHSAGGWTITQPAGVTIYDLAGNSTTGVGGSVSSTGQGDTIELVGVAANTDLRVVSSKGTLAYV